MTEAQQQLIARLKDGLARDPRLRSVWLSGSLGKGVGDPWSDVDLTAVVEEADLRACLSDYVAGRPAMPDTVLAFEVHGRVFSAITPDWERFDVVFLTPSEFSALDGSALKPLLGDPASAPAAREPPVDTRAGERVTALVTEFLRVLGLTPVAVGRGEWLAAQQGLELLRRMLLDLMIEENGVSPGQRGGAKRLNPFLSAEQRALLETLDPAPARGPALIAASLAHARPFLARARVLADHLGARWPTAFEDATRRHLRITLGLEI